jgi:hypothetical protein
MVIARYCSIKDFARLAAVSIATDAGCRSYVQLEVKLPPMYQSLEEFGEDVQWLRTTLKISPPPSTSLAQMGQWMVTTVKGSEFDRLSFRHHERQRCPSDCTILSCFTASYCSTTLCLASIPCLKCIALPGGFVCGFLNAWGLLTWYDRRAAPIEERTDWMRAAARSPVVYRSINV